MQISVYLVDWQKVLKRHSEGTLEEDIFEATDEFMNSAIAFSGYCQDIEFTDSEFFTLAISPKSASKLCRVGTQIDFDRFEDLYISGCPEKLKAVLAKYSQSKDLNRSFQEVFLPYVKDWLNLMKVATQQERGILVGWG